MGNTLLEDCDNAINGYEWRGVDING